MAVLCPSTDGSTISVLVLDGAVDLESVVDEPDRLEIRTADSSAATLDEIAEIDCLVCESRIVDDPDLEFVDRVRDRYPTLPIVVATGDRERSQPLRALADADPWTDVINVDGSAVDVEQFRFRISILVEHRQLTDLAERTLAGIELATDAIAIVNPAGNFEFVNRPFATLFDTDRDTLVDRAWQTVFTGDAADRLETTAIPTVADGWRWRGTTTCQRFDGSTFPVSARLDGLEDGSLVFVLEPQ